MREDGGDYLARDGLKGTHVPAKVLWSYGSVGGNFLLKVRC